MLVMEAFGRVLALEPYLATVVLGGTALRLAGNEAQKSAILPQIAEGNMILAFAHGERQARYDLSDVLTTAKPKAAAGCSTAPKASFCTATAPQRLIVSARTAGERDDPDGISCSWSMRRRTAWRGAVLPDARRHPCGGDFIERCRGRRGRRAGRNRRGIPGHRAGRRGRHCRDRGRSGRRDGSDAGDDPRIPEDPHSNSAGRSARTRFCSTAPPRC